MKLIVKKGFRLIEKKKELLVHSVVRVEWRCDDDDDDDECCDIAEFSWVIENDDEVKEVCSSAKRENII